MRRMLLVAALIAALVAAILGAALGYRVFAANAEITEADYAELSQAQRSNLLDCQMDKLNKEVPKKEADEFMTDYAVANMAGEKAPGPPLQIQMIRKYDVSCTHEEIVPKPITAEEVGPLSDEESSALLNCQAYKLGQEMGNKEASHWMADKLEEGLLKPGAEKPYSLKDFKSDEDIVPLQEVIIEEKGISCTEDEMWKYAD